VLRRIFGPNKAEVTGRRRKLHNEELRGLHSLTSVIRMTKSRMMRWAWVCRVNGGEEKDRKTRGETYH
jgi:hypothetical protein